jgi:hypothetical protein
MEKNIKKQETAKNTEKNKAKRQHIENNKEKK